MTEGSVDSTDSFGITGRVTVRVWDVPTLREYIPRWSALPREARHARLSDPDALPVEPTHVGTSTNMILDNYLEAFAAGNYPQPTHLALGDGTTSPAAGNDALNNEVYRTVVGQDEADGKDRLTSTFISQNEANGQALRELGFTDGATSDDWQQLTHTVLQSSDQIDEKTSSETVTYDYDLQFRDN